MMTVALKMLVGDRGKYIAMLIGIGFACMALTQQAATFAGIMIRTFAAVTDLAYPDIWVMDPKVQFIDDIKPLQDTMLYRVRGIQGVGWAVPLYKGNLRARLSNGTFQACSVLGLDDATLIGGPPVIVEGALADLRRADAVIVDEIGARTKLANPPKRPGDQPTPLKVGDELELNDHRAVVVGICRNSRSFQSQPVVYTTYARAVTFAPMERKLLSFVLVGAAPGQDQGALCQRIHAATGLQALTRDQFKALSFWYFMINTGIPLNIGVGVVIVFVVGIAVTGQAFYSFTQDNLRYFGAMKAMGATNWLLLRMTVLQALLVGLVGYGIGVGIAAAIGHIFRNTEMSFRLLWWIPLYSATAVLVICVASAVFSIRKVMKLEPAVVFRS